MIMGSSTKPRVVLVLLLLCTSSVLSKRCVKHDANAQLISVDDCKANELCGIDPKTGFGQGCVPTTHCPSGISGDKFFCEKGKSSCCCVPHPPDPLGRPFDTVSDERVTTCNNLLNPEDDERWKKACKNQDLNPLPICQITTKGYRYCATSADNNDNVGCKGLDRLCGIDMKTGDLQGCVSASKCPSYIYDEKLRCETDSCCCLSKDQHNYGLEKFDWACNNIFNWRDIRAWQQLCQRYPVPELEVCKKEPEIPPVTLENIPSECLEHCKKEQPFEKKGVKPFEVDCTDPQHPFPPSDGPRVQNCIGPCPRTCEECIDYGKKLNCPGGLPIKRLPIEYDTETYVVIFFLLPVFGLAVTAAIIYAVFMSMKKKKIEVVVDPMALNRFYSTYPRPGFGFWQPPPQEETSEQVAADGSQQQVGQQEQQQDADKKIQ